MTPVGASRPPEKIRDRKISDLVFAVINSVCLVIDLALLMTQSGPALPVATLAAVVAGPAAAWCWYSWLR